MRKSPRKVRARTEAEPATITTTALNAVMPPIGIIGGDANGPYIVTGHTDAGCVVERPDGSTETLPPKQMPKLPVSGGAFYRAAHVLHGNRRWLNEGKPTARPDYVRPGLVVFDDSWTGPSIILAVDDENEMVTLLTSLGVQTADLASVLSRDDGMPVAGGALDILADGIAALVRSTPGILPNIARPEPVKAGMGRVMDLIGQAITCIADVENEGTSKADWPEELHDVWQSLINSYHDMGRILTDASCTGTAGDTAEMDHAAGNILAGMKAFPKPPTWGGPPREGVMPLVGILNHIGAAIEGLHTFAASDASKALDEDVAEADGPLWQAHNALLDVTANFLSESMNTRAGDVLKAIRMPERRTRPTSGGDKPGKALDVKKFHRLATAVEQMVLSAWQDRADAQDDGGGLIALTLDGQEVVGGWPMDGAEARDMRDALSHITDAAEQIIGRAYTRLVEAGIGGGA
jgi:hypothetical protein